jgi:hypothetical protein
VAVGGKGRRRRNWLAGWRGGGQSSRWGLMGETSPMQAFWLGQTFLQERLGYKYSVSNKHNPNRGWVCMYFDHLCTLLYHWQNLLTFLSYLLSVVLSNYFSPLFYAAPISYPQNPVLNAGQGLLNYWG